ncbi:MAG: DNA polymerase III subunit gamma/tau [Phycisphaerae bacterium]|nr:DNA polymerase III subunit gamma/tau [Phycisphaerae bacterium]
MSYTVLARRYRSDSFDDVVGQEAIAQTLKNAIATNRVAHAYLFTGTRGVGKTSMARILAKALNCSAFDNATTEPCCKCDSCVAISEGNDIDVIEIDGASNTGVEHIRELRQNAIYSPARSRYKIYIIDEVHMLSTSAFNALLKTLEEPPEHVKFIFATTEAQKILPTILSRCQRFDFRNIQTEDIAKHLTEVLKGEGVKADEDAVRRIARLARGSMRDGLSLLDQMLSMSAENLTLESLNELLGVPKHQVIIDLAQAMGNGDLALVLKKIDQAINEGLSLEALAGALQDHYRDLMVLSNCGADTELVEIIDKPTRDTMVNQAKNFDSAALVYYITVTEELRRSLKSGTSGRALLEAAIVRLTAADRFMDTKVLIDRLGKIGTAGATNVSRPAQPPANRPVASKPAGSFNQYKQAPKTATARPTVQAPAELSIQYFQQNWSTILAGLNKAGAMSQGFSLKPSSPHSFEGNVLTIAYKEKDQGFKKNLEEQEGGLTIVKKAMTKVIGHDIEIKLIVSNESMAISETKESTSKKKQLIAPGAKPNTEQVQAANNDPNVQKVIKALEGSVISLERIGKNNK